MLLSLNCIEQINISHLYTKAANIGQQDNPRTSTECALTILLDIQGKFLTDAPGTSQSDVLRTSCINLLEMPLGRHSENVPQRAVRGRLRHIVVLCVGCPQISV